MKRSILNVTALSLEHNVAIHNEVVEDIFVYGLEAYLDSILLNFLTNSIKYRAIDRDSYLKVYATQERGFSVIHFEDNGLGIDLNRHGSKLFGMYKVFHGNKDAQGLGLFITKNQVEAMGGRIEVKSEVGIGSKFSVYLKNEL